MYPNYQTSKALWKTGTTVDAADLELLICDLKSWSEKNSAFKTMPKEIIQRIDNPCFNFIGDHSTPHTTLSSKL
jgi:hypothetical protein